MALAPKAPRKAYPPHEGGHKTSLNNRLLRHVLLPLALTWALGSVVTLALSQHYAGEAFDRSLLDDAYLVASHVVLRDGALALTLSDADISTVLFDQSEREFFAVQRGDGSLLAGHPGLHPPGERQTRARTTDIEYGDPSHQGRGLRSVTLRRALPLPFSVTIAQTTASRSRLLQRLLLTSVVPQIALLALLAWWLRRAIHGDLQPLAELQQAVEQRDAADLAPVGTRLTEHANTRDVLRLSLSINALLQRLGDSIQAQREFAGNVAHELRTPLAGIRALAEYGLANGDPAVQRAQLHAIVDSQGRASHLVDQLLALALADEAQGSLQLEAVRLDELVRGLLLQHLPRADALGVDLGADGLEQPREVLANKALLEGLLNNLIDNALRYGRAPAPERSALTVAIDEQHGHLRLSVTDNGTGLPAAERGPLLRRWTQGGSGLRVGKGAGLGLAIVTRYADLMHAGFALDDAPGGRGLRASVVFSG